MTNHQKTFEYSEDNELDYVETTSESNGYPANLRYALTFETISDLESHAKQLWEQGHNPQRVILHKRDGWNLWHRQGADVHKGMFRDESKHNHSAVIDTQDNADEVAFRVVAEAREFHTLEDLQKTTHQCEWFRDEIEDILSGVEDEGQQSATVFFDPDQNYRVDYYATDETTGYYYDTHNYQVGLIVNWKDEEETNED